MRTPLFSIVLPTRERASLLSDAVASVLRQSVSDFECVVVADGDPHVSVSRDPRIRVIKRELRGGAASARNTGLHASRGKYVTFLDDDDLYTPNRLELAMNGLDRAPIALCWRASVAQSEATTWSGRLEGDVGDRILRGPVPNVGQVALERRSAPLFDERFHVSEDVEWWVRAAHLGDVATVPRIGYLLRDHEGERQTRRLEDRLASRILLLETHPGYFAANHAAAAYQWRRVGGLAGALGAREVQRKAFRRSMRLRPGIRGLAHLAGSYLPRTVTQ